MTEYTAPTDGIVDLIGCGFGPAGLGIAVALVDKWNAEPVRHLAKAFQVLGCADLDSR